MSFPDLPYVPELPQHRVNRMTVPQILSQASAALHAAEDAAYHLERSNAANHQFALLRQVVIECRRSTFVLQKLSSRVEGWKEWYEPRQDAMRADPLMAYLANLRTQIEKEGLPAVMAELVDAETGRVIADVACGEDEFGIWISGAVRRDEANQPRWEQGELDRESILLRSFRLPDPPMSHLGRALTDFRFVSLADLAIEHIRVRVVAPAFAEFGESAASHQSAR